MQLPKGFASASQDAERDGLSKQLKLCNRYHVQVNPPIPSAGFLLIILAA
jgi:hypothetical protein